MSTATLTDVQLRRDVLDELRWEPSVDAAHIGVSVKDGVVTLAGFTHSYSDRLEAELAVKHVAGVHAVANDIEVRLPAIDQRPDPDIARDAVATPVDGGRSRAPGVLPGTAARVAAGDPPPLER